MKLLLDTHALIWWDENPSRLGAAARAACFDPTNDLLLSAASAWEIQIKVMLGKLTLRKPLRQLIGDQIQQNSLAILPVQIEHVLGLDTLASHHKDPFDRMLIAQAIAEGCSIVSHDRVFSLYPAPVIW